MRITPLPKPPCAEIFVPGSKSITNRALVLAALADGRSVLHKPLRSDDTAVMMDALRSLGFDVESVGDGDLAVTGLSGQIPSREAELWTGGSGTTIRFLTALTCLGRGVYRLDGDDRMRQRPQADLVDAMRSLGAELHGQPDTGGAPLVVHGSGAVNGGRVLIQAGASSQFVSAALMIAPFARTDLTIEVEGPLRPHYVNLTLQMMASWGVLVMAGPSEQAQTAFRIPSGQRYTAQSRYEIEPDASSSSYFFAAAAATGGRVTVRGLRASDMQGDVRFATEALTKMGCSVSDSRAGLSVQGPPRGALQGVDMDMSAISDTSFTLAAIAPFAQTPTTVRNIGHTRLQESDRIAAICAELSRLGVRAEERPDGFTVYPAAAIRPGKVRTYRDHRIAMSFAVLGLLAPGIEIEDPGCVSKTFPEFWQQIEELRRE